MVCSAVLTCNRLPQVFEAGPGQAQDGAGLSVEPPRSSELSKRINALLSSLRAGRSTYASCFVVRQGVSHPGLLTISACALTIAGPRMCCGTAVKVSCHDTQITCPVYLGGKLCDACEGVTNGPLCRNTTRAACASLVC